MHRGCSLCYLHCGASTALGPESTRYGTAFALPPGSVSFVFAPGGPVTVQGEAGMVWAFL
uniref:Uncharacterized protein n=1 Tax=Picea glauca TaxID=3330 RepID=A0A101M0H6_PICGL|nr:hypothetical protein ABT39_MTgene4692 [Picea glauca]